MSKIALLQFDPTVGDLEQNCRRLSDLAQLAESHGAAVGVSTELAVCGYPPRDLLMERDFVEHSMEAALQVSTTLPVLIGTPIPPMMIVRFPPMAWSGQGLSSPASPTTNKAASSPRNNCFQRTMPPMRLATLPPKTGRAWLALRWIHPRCDGV